VDDFLLFEEGVLVSKLNEKGLDWYLRTHPHIENEIQLQEYLLTLGDTLPKFHTTSCFQDRVGDYLERGAVISIHYSFGKEILIKKGMGCFPKYAISFPAKNFIDFNSKREPPSFICLAENTELVFSLCLRVNDFKFEKGRGLLII